MTQPGIFATGGGAGSSCGVIIMAYEFLTPEKAWETLRDYYDKYYRQYIAAYSGDRDELNSTSDNGMFWRRSGKCKVHVPVAADIAAVSANLLFAEEPFFTTYDEETEENATDQQKRLDELVELNNIHGKLNEGAESCAAIGDVYLKLNWRTDNPSVEYPVMTVAQGDSAWPEFLLGVLQGIHFFTVLKRDMKTGAVTRVYELYEPGKITMAIYEGDDTNLGSDVSDEELKKYGFTREIKPPVDDMLAVHIPNMRPNREFRDINLGRSDFDELRNLMDSLDEAYSSWMRDVRLGKGRTIVPAEYLKRPPQAMLEGLAASASWEFDPEIETYVAIDMSDGNGNTPGITLQQFAIRSGEHAATCVDLLRNIVSIAGYAPQTFGMDISGMAQSGTALHIREKKSYDTRGKKQTYWKAPLEQIMTAMIHLDNALWPDKGSDADDEVKVKFSDAAANDITTMSGAVQMLVAANAVSMLTRLQMIHPDWTKKQLNDEIQRIQQENTQAMMQAAAAKAASTGAMPMEGAEGQPEEQPVEQPTEQPTEETQPEEQQATAEEKQI